MSGTYDYSCNGDGTKDVTYNDDSAMKSYSDGTRPCDCERCIEFLMTKDPIIEKDANRHKWIKDGVIEHLDKALDLFIGLNIPEEECNNHNEFINRRNRSLAKLKTKLKKFLETVTYSDYTDHDLLKELFEKKKKQREKEESDKKKENRRLEKQMKETLATSSMFSGK